MNLIGNQTKYGLIKATNFTIDQWNHHWKITVEMYSTHIEGKSVVAEVFIRTLKKNVFNIKKCAYW